MAASAFGTILKRLREGRGLSLREFGELSKLDHAYVHRLESGEREAPSEEALGRLCRALKPSKRQERLLRFLLGRTVPLDLIDRSIVDDEAISLDDFESAAQMNFRGKVPSSPDDWRVRIEGIRKLREEFERG